MNKTLLIMSLAFLGFVGCQPPSTLFYWGKYSSTLYDYKKNPSDTTLSVHKTTLLDIMKKAPEKRKLVPPGVYAEYGYIMLKEGKEIEGMEYLAKEEQSFPESKMFIQRIKDEYSRGEKMKAIVFILLSFSLVGCGTYVTKEEFAPNMYKDHPQTIVVLPPMNKSTSAEAKEFYTTTIAEPLTQSGYYVYPMEVVNDVLKQEGLYDTETMLAVPPQKFREYFGADAVLYLTILEWNTSYMVTAGSVTVKVAYELKSTRTGDVIWFYDDAVTVSTSGDSGNMGGWAGLLAQVITTAIKTAATDYVPVAKQANEKILLAIPFGKYHKQYNADMKVKVEKKEALKPVGDKLKKESS